MELGLLGVVQARSQGRMVELGHGRQRSVLAALLVEPNRPHTADRLIRHVWGDEAPARAHTTLYGYLHRLRRILAAIPEVRITRANGGYVVAVDEMAVDLHRFRRLVVQAGGTCDDRALRLLDEALGLWRDDALAGLRSPWIDQLRYLLGQERRAAQLDYNDIALRTGRHHALLPALSAQARLQPLDERLAAQFMLALHRCGRQTDALDHYRRLHRHLTRELGIAPGRPLRELHQRLLSGAVLAGSAV